jgi:hypothetical protein
MTVLSLDQLSLIQGGQAAPAAAPAQPAQPAPLTQGQTDLGNTITNGANANLCSSFDRNALTLGADTPLGAAMLASGDQCWNNLRQSMAQPQQ